MKNEITIPAVFNLAETLDCGQAFRWEEFDGKWQGIVKGKTLIIEKIRENLVLHCSHADYDSVWRQYFDIDTDYSVIRSELSSMSEVLKQAADFAPGIRILCQDPWEALCTFIISQNNNIKRIKGIVKRLCEFFGEKTDIGYTFPSAHVIAGLSEDDLAPIRSGFRAKYIISAATMVDSGKIILNDIYNLPLQEAREELMKIKGVGPKVADCALLYGFHRTECFPMDVWMKRAMSTLFPNNTPEDFGKNAGIAQQYIFHYSRMNPQLFAEK